MVSLKTIIDLFDLKREIVKNTYKRLWRSQSIIFYIKYMDIIQTICKENGRRRESHV